MAKRGTKAIKTGRPPKAIRVTGGKANPGAAKAMTRIMGGYSAGERQKIASVALPKP